VDKFIVPTYNNKAKNIWIEVKYFVISQTIKKITNEEFINSIS